MMDGADAPTVIEWTVSTKRQHIADFVAQRWTEVFLMAKNDFLAKQKARDRAVFEAGEQIGMQRMIDVISIVLHDPEIMGKDTFGKDRMKRVFDGVKNGMDF